jgi:phosphomannomutase
MDYNGIKMVLLQRDLAKSDAIQVLKRCIEADDFFASSCNTGSYETMLTLPLTSNALSAMSNFPAQMKIVCDGLRYRFAAATLQAAPLFKGHCEPVELYCRWMQILPNSHPDPHGQKNSIMDVIRAFKRNRCGKLGIAFDGDGDRPSGSMQRWRKSFIRIANSCCSLLKFSAAPGGEIISCRFTQQFIRTGFVDHGGKPSLYKPAMH